MRVERMEGTTGAAGALALATLGFEALAFFATTFFLGGAATRTGAASVSGCFLAPAARAEGLRSERGAGEDLTFAGVFFLGVIFLGVLFFTLFLLETGTGLGVGAAGVGMVGSGVGAVATLGAGVFAGVFTFLADFLIDDLGLGVAISLGLGVATLLMLLGVEIFFFELTGARRETRLEGVAFFTLFLTLLLGTTFCFFSAGDAALTEERRERLPNKAAEGVDAFLLADMLIFFLLAEAAEEEAAPPPPVLDRGMGSLALWDLAVVAAVFQGESKETISDKRRMVPCYGGKVVGAGGVGCCDCCGVCII